MPAAPSQQEPHNKNQQEERERGKEEEASAVIGICSAFEGAR
jgi:hypothetical protein